MKKVFLFLGVLLCVVIYVYFQQLQKLGTPQIPAIASLPIAPVVSEITAINIKTPGEITADKVMSGDAALIVVRDNSGSYMLDYIEYIGRIANYDVNHDGIINAQDPIYANLALGFINPQTNQIHIVPFQNAGIVAIVLDQSEVNTPTPLGTLPPGYWQVHSLLVLSDGTRIKSYHVPVPTTFLEQLVPEPGVKLAPIY